MQDINETTRRRIKIQYLQDTLFGVNALTSECVAQMVRQPPDLQLQLAPPWPSGLQHAHTITFEWDGSTYRGVVHHCEPLANGELLLAITPEPY